MTAIPRYADTTEQKSNGATYTPKSLSDFVAMQIFNQIENTNGKVLRILDPAVGDGELLESLIAQLSRYSNAKYEIYGFDTNNEALESAEKRLDKISPHIQSHFKKEDFLDFVSEKFLKNKMDLFSSDKPNVVEPFDVIIANPPYVRTQIMGAAKAQKLAETFGLIGRVDLYHAFLTGMAKTLKVGGVAGIIVSNRFMSTRSGAQIRAEIIKDFRIKKVWDLGDTKIFNAAVLPAVLLLEKRETNFIEEKNSKIQPEFISIYETHEFPGSKAGDVFEALSCNGIVEIKDGKRFYVQKGYLEVDETPDGVWRVSNTKNNSWLAKVREHTWNTFGELGKIKVGVKTTADDVFINSDWNTMLERERPELLRPLSTHHIARRFKPLESENLSWILYPHIIVDGKRKAVDISRYPRAFEYLKKHEQLLKNRKYVIEAGRQWYEIWVPHDPEDWNKPKIVFRDISKKPTFWFDASGSVVNGDCYWLSLNEGKNPDLLWLALGVSNSTFIEKFYDHMFHNKLYAGRRRFITQYVEHFPIPDPNREVSKKIILLTKKIYENTSLGNIISEEEKLDKLISSAFGV